MIKDNIKTWLKRSGREREWLGQQLGVSKKTVDNWLSIQDIPNGKMRLIERLMADDMAEDARRKQLSEPTNQVFSVEVDLIRFRRYNAAANAEGLLMHEWTVKTLDAAVDRISATIGLRTSMTNSAPIYRVSEPPSVNSATEIAKEAPKATDTPPGFIAMPVAVTEEEKVIIEEAARRQKQQSAKQPGSAGSQSHTSRKPSPPQITRLALASNCSRSSCSRSSSVTLPCSQSTGTNTTTREVRGLLIQSDNQPRQTNQSKSKILTVIHRNNIRPLAAGSRTSRISDREPMTMNTRQDNFETLPADPRYARFGEAMWKYITNLGGDFCGEEISEDILPLAQAAGLCCRVEYDPAIHGEGIEADPGSEIWYWGNAPRQARAAQGVDDATG